MTLPEERGVSARVSELSPKWQQEGQKHDGPALSAAIQGPMCELRSGFPLVQHPSVLDA